MVAGVGAALLLLASSFLFINPRDAASASHNGNTQQNLTFGAIFPDTSLLSQQRKYQQKLRDGVSSMTKGRTAGLRFMQLFSVHAKAVRMSLQPTPR